MEIVPNFRTSRAGAPLQYVDSRNIADRHVKANEVPTEAGEKTMNEYSEYYTEYVKTLCVFDNTARTRLQEIWENFLRWPLLPGHAGRYVKRRDLETELRKVCTIGLVAGVKYCGGICLPGTPRRSRWYTTPNGSLHLAIGRAINRERGEAERVECAASVG